MKLIWLKTKELQSYKVDFSWQSIMGPLVIVSTSYHREYLLSSEAPLLIESAKHHGTSCHRKHLLSSRVPLIIGSTSSYRECKASWDLLSSEAPLIIESTSYHLKHLLSSKRPLLIESAKHHGTSCHRKHLLSSRVPLIIGDTSSRSTSCYRKAFLSDRERHRWLLRLADYSFTGKHLPGKENPSDYMSRHPRFPPITSQSQIA